MKTNNKKEKIEKLILEIIKYSKKCNAMMMESETKDAPQILKLTLLKKLIDEYFSHFKKIHGEEKIIEARKFIDEFIEKSGKIKITEDINEVEKYIGKAKNDK